MAETTLQDQTDTNNKNNSSRDNITVIKKNNKTKKKNNKTKKKTKEKANSIVTWGLQGNI